MPFASIQQHNIMRKDISNFRQWEVSKWASVTHIKDTETGKVYRAEEEFTSKLTPLDELRIDWPIDKFRYCTWLGCGQSGVS